MHILMMLIVLSSCKNSDVFQPTCTSFTLRPIYWKYCNPQTLSRCYNQNDTLEIKKLYVVNDIVGEIRYSIVSGPCILTDNYGFFTPGNLPECFFKSGLKVKFSGVARNSTFFKPSCGPDFEITKLEEIP